MASKLMKACEKENITELKSFLQSSKHRKTINVLYPWPYSDSIKIAVLSYACFSNTHVFVNILLENGARDDIEDTNGSFPIHNACLSDIDTLAKVKMLVENLGNVNRREKMDATPLMIVRCNDTLKYLIQKGARIDDVDKYGYSALHHASIFNRPIIISSLLNHGADVNYSDNASNTPLHVGSLWANLDAIKALVASPSCDVHLKKKHGQTALDIARLKPHENRDYDPVIEYLENVAMNPVALLGTRLNSIEISCDALKASKNLMNKSQCKRCDELTKRVVDLEKKMKQVINDYARDSDVDTLAKVKLLVERNADNVNRRGKWDATPIMIVKCSDAFDYLIQKGARVDEVDKNGRSALHHASYHNRHSIINTLLRHGANVNLIDKLGDTPLLWGAHFANLDVIKTLVASPSCDVNLKNKHGQSALDVARSKPEEGHDYDPVIDYLEDVVMNPVALFGIRLNSMDISCDVLKAAKDRMNKSQCKRCDELTKRVVDLEKKMKQVINDKKKGEALSQKENDLIQQLQEEIHKLNEQIQQLTQELETIKRKAMVEPAAQSSGTAEYSADLLAKAVRGCFDKLIKDIHCDDHAPSLFAKRALSLDEYDQVKAAVGGKIKMETMLNFLLRKKNPAWASLFLASLKSSPACIKSVEYIEEECRRPSLAAENTIV